jgi:DUF1680 family protein
MWCCVGTGMENQSKYNAVIYTKKNDSLFLNLFIPSDLIWKDRGVKIRQQTNFPYEEKTSLIVTEGASDFTLMIRYPKWVSPGSMRVLINHKSMPVTVNAYSYVAVRRFWKTGDTIQISLPMHNTIEHLPNQPEYIAFLRGPILLAAKTGTEDLRGLFADDSRWGQIPSGKMLPVDKAPIIIKNNLHDLATELVPVKNELMTFKTPHMKMINPVQVVFQPFYQIHDARYMIYWMALTKEQYKFYLDTTSSRQILIR